MKDQIIAAIKTKYQSLGFGDKAIEGVAGLLVPTITDATQIETAIAGVEPHLKLIQGEIDGRVFKLKTENEELKKLVPEKKEEPVKVPEGETPTEKMLRETLAKIVESNTALTQRIEKMETGASSQTREQKLEADFKDAHPIHKKQVLELFKAKTFATDAEFDTFVSEKLAENTVFVKSVNEGNLNLVPKPILTLPGKDGVSHSTFKDMMNQAVENKLASAAESK